MPHPTAPCSWEVFWNSLNISSDSICQALSMLFLLIRCLLPTAPLSPHLWALPLPLRLLWRIVSSWKCSPPLCWVLSLCASPEACALLFVLVFRYHFSNRIVHAVFLSISITRLSFLGAPCHLYLPRSLYTLKPSLEPTPTWYLTNLSLITELIPIFCSSSQSSQVVARECPPGKTVLPNIVSLFRRLQPFPYTHIFAQNS